MQPNAAHAVETGPLATGRTAEQQGGVSAHTDGSKPNGSNKARAEELIARDREIRQRKEEAEQRAKEVQEALQMEAAALEIERALMVQTNVDSRKHQTTGDTGGDHRGVRGPLLGLHGVLHKDLRLKVESEGDVSGRVSGLTGICRIRGDLTFVSLGIERESNLSGIICSGPIEKHILGPMSMSGWGDHPAIAKIEEEPRRLLEEAITLDLKKGYHEAKDSYVKADAGFAKMARAIKGHAANLDHVYVVPPSGYTQEDVEKIRQACLTEWDRICRNIAETNRELAAIAKKEKWASPRVIPYFVGPATVVYLEGVQNVWSDGSKTPVVSHIDPWFPEFDQRPDAEKAFRYKPYQKPDSLGDDEKKWEEFWGSFYKNEAAQYEWFREHDLLPRDGESQRRFARRLLQLDETVLKTLLKAPGANRKEILRYLLTWKPSEAKTKVERRDDGSLWSVPYYGHGEEKLLAGPTKVRFNLTTTEIQLLQERHVVHFVPNGGDFRPNNGAYPMLDTPENIRHFIELTPDEAYAVLNPPKPAEPIRLQDRPRSAEEVAELRRLEGEVIDVPKEPKSAAPAAVSPVVKKQWWKFMG